MQKSLVMDPAHLISPPRAHPSGSMNGITGPSGSGIGGGLDGHGMDPLDDIAATTHRKSTNVVHETWFMALVITMLVAILISAAAAMLFFKRRHQLTKELGHLSGKKNPICRKFPFFYASSLKFASLYTAIYQRVSGIGIFLGSPLISFLFCVFVSAVVSANEITALNINGKDSLWIDRGWRSADTDKDSGLSETKLLSNPNSQSNYTSDGGTDYAEVDTRNMSTFYNCRKVS